MSTPSNRHNTSSSGDRSFRESLDQPASRGILALRRAARDSKGTVEPRVAEPCTIVEDDGTDEPIVKGFAKETGQLAVDRAAQNVRTPPSDDVRQRLLAQIGPPA